jgi:hypothetical protein
VIQLVAPLVAAACVALLYGPENDPAEELVLTTPTSPVQILLARLALVFGYNLILACGASLGPSPFISLGALTAVIQSWLAPMTFLSACAVLLSLNLGSLNAIFITYMAWIGQFIAVKWIQSPELTGVYAPGEVAYLLQRYAAFWASSPLLFGLSAAILAVAVWSLRFQGARNTSLSS